MIKADKLKFPMLCLIFCASVSEAHAEYNLAPVRTQAICASVLNRLGVNGDPKKFDVIAKNNVTAYIKYRNSHDYDGYQYTPEILAEDYAYFFQESTQDHAAGMQQEVKSSNLEEDYAWVAVLKQQWDGLSCEQFVDFKG
ncbi:hypothetical protein B9P84_16655 [Citrobacter braakii]|uniref:hypothetical protein n=1 Tax=Citrobacter TaxID=544 RepID=UPI00032ED940|nr:MULTISPECIES: hypothetical protein [Citrobacter]ELN4155439.1 hypothetical protein [Citrobacter braakii]EOQ48514.1 hypothetical protein WC7_02758 [Citrobacter sp. KTE151]MCY9797095.1 hypothetical protein [Citrobacter braakii]MDL4385259.1 hypothetical protein [Citrobacter braakii]NCL79240.1 hypothetical protein [Citrobacter braakii]